MTNRCKPVAPLQLQLVTGWRTPMEETDFSESGLVQEMARDKRILIGDQFPNRSAIRMKKACPHTLISYSVI